jgi:hypothetical protein
MRAIVRAGRGQATPEPAFAGSESTYRAARSLLAEEFFTPRRRSLGAANAV